jgi:hypothetical protein
LVPPSPVLRPACSGDSDGGFETDDIEVDKQDDIETDKEEDNEADEDDGWETADEG